MLWISMMLFLNNHHAPYMGWPQFHMYQHECFCHHCLKLAWSYAVFDWHLGHNSSQNPWKDSALDLTTLHTDPTLPSSTRWHWIDYFGLEFFNYLSPLREMIIKQVPFLLAPYPPYRLTALSRLKLNVHVFLLPPQSILFCCFIGPADLLQVSLWFEFFWRQMQNFLQW